MNNKVKFLRGTSNEYAVVEKDSDTIYFTTDDGKLYIGDKEVSGSDIIIDDTLSDTSTNPVQNKTVKQAIDNKADKTVATISADGLMSAEDKGKLDSVNDTYALKSKYGDTTIDVGRKGGTDVGRNSTAEGDSTTASGYASHAEGDSTTASGYASHAEGEMTTASGHDSHAEGFETAASGDKSHAEGYATTASGICSHAGGSNTKALKEAEFAHGKYNQSNDDTLFSIGDGTADDARHNAFEITATGGKLHDKDIATTDLIPTSLPANGGNADTVDNKHYTDFSQNAILSTIEQVNDPNLESGIYSVENVSMSFSSDVTSNWFMLIVNKHRASAGFGTQIAIPYDNGEQRGTFYRVCRAGNWGNWVRIADENIISNENLLLNPDFRINQQGKSVYTGTTECWDKWTINAGWETARSADDIAAIFTCVTPQVNSWVVNQNIPNYKDYRGKTVTFSAQIVTASTKFNLMINDGVDQLAIPLTTGRCSVTYTVSDNATQLQCVISTNGQESLNEQIAVLSTKLELGTIATTFVPPNPSIELAKVRAVNDDFVNAAPNQIQIPNNADVPAWIYANGKRYQQYMTNSDNTGLTNVPNDSVGWVWYWFDGINIFAREWTTGKYYICDTINGGFSGWKDIYTSGYKPYVVGTLSEQANDSPVTLSFTIFDFTPSKVICQFGSGNAFFANVVTNGFSLTIPAGTTTIHYIAFK